MTNETILDAIGMIDDDAVYDAKAWQSESEQEKRVRWIGRKFGVLMLAAVLMLALGTIVCAIATNAFQSFFEQKGSLTPEQVQYLEEKTVGIGESVTINDYNQGACCIFGKKGSIKRACRVHGYRHHFL